MRFEHISLGEFIFCLLLNSAASAVNTESELERQHRLHHEEAADVAEISKLSEEQNLEAADEQRAVAQHAAEYDAERQVVEAEMIAARNVDHLLEVKTSGVLRGNLPLDLPRAFLPGKVGLGTRNSLGIVLLHVDLTQSLNVLALSLDGTTYVNTSAAIIITGTAEIPFRTTCSI